MEALILRRLGISSGKPIAVLDDSAAAKLGVRPHDRILMKWESRQVVAIVNVAYQVPEDVVLASEEVFRALSAEEGSIVEVAPAPIPDSLRYIRDLLSGARLGYREIKSIVEDIVNDELSEVELAALVTAMYLRGMSVDEALSFSRAMVETGETLDLEVKPVLDKHSIGGVPGDKTTLLVVPIIASMGYHIPKTSSRAITSPAGTADRAEVLMPVEHSVEEVKRIVMKTGGCIVWGGALHLAPADDKIVRVEYPLSIDPFLVPSIMAKKKAVNSTHVVIDIPVGRGAKVKTIGEANYLANELVEVGERLGMKVVCALTIGEQPIGYTAGPALEAREALLALMGMGPGDLVDKAASIAGLLLESVGVRNGKGAALEAIRSGKALQKLKEIIEMQGGDPLIKPDDIPVGSYNLVVEAENGGMVMWINNTLIASVARAAGAPKDKGAGVRLHVKIGDVVKKGDPIMTIYSEHSTKLQSAERLLAENPQVGIGVPERQMLITSIPAGPLHVKYPIIER